jgi:hypothetical protein
MVPAKLPPLISLLSLLSFIHALRFGLRSPIDDEDDDDEDDWGYAKPEQRPQEGMLRRSLPIVLVVEPLLKPERQAE